MVASASSSPSNPCAPFQKKDARTSHARKCVEREGKKEGRQGCQRYGRHWAPWEEHAHARRVAEAARPNARRYPEESNRGVCPIRSAEAVSDVVKTSGPPVMPRGALDSVGCPRGESRGSEPGTREVRVHAVRLGGRCRLDASRVFYAGRSQDLVE
jgi:hypothetical protein